MSLDDEAVIIEWQGKHVEIEPLEIGPVPDVRRIANIRSVANCPA